ncbi:MAG: hypothetical protein ABI175_27205 [Polyangiales bacterium]
MSCRHLVVVVLILAACGSKKEGDRGKKASTEDKATDISTLFSGTTVTLPEEVAKATFGAPQAEVSKAVGTETTYMTSKKFDGVSYDLDYSREEKKLEGVTVASNSDLEPVLTKQWGKPIKTKKGEPFWFDAKTGTRAWIPDYAKGKRVTFARYDSLDTLFGPKGFELAFAAGKPLLGATVDELSAAWGGKLCDFAEAGPEVKKAIEDYRTDWNGLWYDKKHSLRLCLAQPRYVAQGTPFGDTIYIGRMGKVENVTFSFQTGGAPELIAEATKFFDAKFGAPTELTTTSGKERWYFDPATKQRAVLRSSEETFSVMVSRYFPVADLLAAEAPGVLSVATKSMPGGAPKAIEKEDPEHFNPHGTLPALVFPASDFDTEEMEVQLESWDKAPTTHAYKVVIHHTDNESAGDAVFALLEKKLGPGKKDAKSTDKDVFWNFKAKDGSKVQARRVSQQWQIEVSK